MSYQHFTKQPIQLITYNNNYFITYFRNQNQNLLLRKRLHQSSHPPQTLLAISPQMPSYTARDATITNVQTIFPPSTSTTNQMVPHTPPKRAKLFKKRGTLESLDWKQERKFKRKLLWARKYLCCWL